MNIKPLIAVAALAAIAGSIAIAQPAKDSKPPAKPSTATPHHSGRGRSIRSQTSAVASTSPTLSTRW